MNDGRHRQLGPLQRFFVRIGSTVLIIVGLSAGNLVLKLTPGTDQSERPFLRAGEVNEKVDVRRFQVTVLTTRVGAVIQAPNKTKHDTQGKWVVLRIRLMAVSKAFTVKYAALHDGQGRTFLATDRISLSIVDGSRILQPGIAVEGDVVFEVPGDAKDLTARFAVDSGDDTERRMDAMSEIAVPVPDSAFLNPEPIVIASLELKP